MIKPLCMFSYVFPVVCLVFFQQNECREYYVAPGGGNSSDGTLTAPFRTIARAADSMEAGDICYLRRGIYQESIIPKTSGTESMPIRFEAYNNEKVIITTTDTVTAWEHHTGTIYKAPIAWNLGPGNNQVFANGEMMIEARYPNIDEEYDWQMSWYGSGEKDGQIFNRSWPPDLPRSLLHPTYFRSAGGYDEKGWYKASDGTLPIKIFNPFICNRGENFWTGALLWNPGNFWGAAGLIKRSTDIADTTILFLETDRFRWPGASVISGVMELLDTEGEWVIQNDTLYFRPPWGMTPDEMRVSVKRRNSVALLSTREYIELADLCFHGGSAVLAESHHCTIDNCHFRYVSHFTQFTYRYDALASGSNTDKYKGNRGIYISGSNNVIKNSSVVYSAASGIIIADTANTVTNCLIHEIDYRGTYAAGVFFTQPHSRQYSNGHEVSHCTIYNCGRSCINFHRTNKYDANIKLMYNNLYGAMCISQDGGTIYADSVPANNIEIGYNWFHKVYTGPGSYVYFDHRGGRDCSIHHNVFFRNHRGQRRFFTFSANNTFMYNNTFVDPNKEVFSLSAQLRKYREEHPGITANNLDASEDQAQWMFVDTVNMDYRLQEESPAIDSGVAIAGITGNAIGRPDLGAYEYEGEQWVPGHTWGESPDVTELWAEGKTVGVQYNTFSPAEKVPEIYLCRGRLMFKAEGDTPWTISLFTCRGIRVARWTRRRPSLLPINILPSGIYTICIQNKTRIIVQRAILVD
ncbi:MAG: hypothetical protein GF401_18520 [Chitinivibrionales bacterium]|nr:hypothetical protein [Chitinivibrionales bacterium]